MITDRLDNLGALHEGVTYFRIHNQIHVTLSVAEVCVSQAVELLGKNLQALGKQNHTCGMDRNLTGLRGKCGSLNADNIADIQLLEILIGLLADAVSGYVGLDVPF